ncbi:DUF3152 domain-containing protein [Streptomyces sp. NPDC059985]|uniref:DUF3152 domain-containing protein n=1 Tax=Streptomyces sp. NPDC059985 TaxID=3347025 RepID=UPI0036D01115
MGRHSRKAPAPAAPAPADGPPRPQPEHYEDPYEDPYGPFSGALYEPAPYGASAAADFPPVPPAPQAQPRRAPEPTVIHQGYVPPAPPGPGARPGGRPEQHEPGGAWGAHPPAEPAPPTVYGDWRGTPRSAAFAPPQPRSAAAPTSVAPRPPVTDPFAADPFAADPFAPDPFAPDPFADDPFVSGWPAPDPFAAAPLVPGPREPEPAAAGERTGSGRGAKFRTYTGMAAAAVTTVLAVVVAGQVALDDDSVGGTRAAGDDGAERAMSGRTDRSEGRPTPDSPPVVAAPAPEQPLTYEQRMALQLPIDPRLKGPGSFDTVAGVDKAPGKGKVVRYRVDVEQGLGMDQQLFADAVQRTLNDPRSWSHGGQMTFERVPAGDVLFVITLASPGTTGEWCAKSSLDTTVDNVSCDSASTERVMINAFRWAQGSTTFGPDQMLAYRQMLINHEVGHRLGHGHVSCQTPGALAPIMQQQTKSLDINNIQCKPNPWVFPGS